MAKSSPSGCLRGRDWRAYRTRRQWQWQRTPSASLARCWGAVLNKPPTQGFPQWPPSLRELAHELRIIEPPHRLRQEEAPAMHAGTAAYRDAKTTIRPWAPRPKTGREGGGERGGKGRG
jgi:hypothetical protein